MRWLHRVRDWYLTLRTRTAIAERECKHDGSEPTCFRCDRAISGW